MVPTIILLSQVPAIDNTSLILQEICLVLHISALVILIAHFTIIDRDEQRRNRK
jgi:hypothetical protein